MLSQPNAALLDRLLRVRARNVVRLLQSRTGQGLTMDDIRPLLGEHRVTLDSVLEELNLAGITLSAGHDSPEEDSNQEPVSLPTFRITQGKESIPDGHEDPVQTSSSMSEHIKASGSAVNSRPNYPEPKSSRSAPIRPLNSPGTRQRAAEAGLGKSHQATAAEYEIQQAQTPEAQNCCVRISNIPLVSTDKEVLDVVTDGKVASFRLSSDPKDKRGADLAFTKRESAEFFLKRIESVDGVTLRGERLRAKFNQMKRAPVEPPDNIRCRVLHVRGPAENFSLLAIVKFLKEPKPLDIEENRSPLNIVESREELLPDGSKRVVIEFACIRGESTNSMKCLNDALAAGIFSNLRITYGTDPCDGGKNLHEPNNWRKKEKKPDKLKKIGSARSWRPN